MRLLISIGLSFFAISSSAVFARAEDSKPLLPDARTHPDDLLLARCNGTISYREHRDDFWQAKKVTILQITRQQVVYLENGGSPIVKSGRNVSSISVEYPIGKLLYWSWDEAKGQYGKKDDSTPVIPDPIDVKSKPFPDGKYGLYLLIRADVLHEELNAALWSLNRERVNELLRQAEELSKFAKQHKTPQAVVNLFALGDYAQKQDKQAKAFWSAWKQLIEAKAERAELMASAQHMAAIEQASGTAAALLGGVVALQTNGKKGLDFVSYGLDHAIKSSFVHAQYNILITELENDKTKEVSSIHTLYCQTQDDLGKLLPLAAGALQLDRELFNPSKMNQLVQKDIDAVIQRLKEQSEALKAKGVTHPLLEARIAKFKGVLIDKPNDRPRKSEEIYKLAQDTIQAVKSVPEGELFDIDRAFVLGSVGDLVHRAVTMKQGSANWSQCFDPRADFGLRVLECTRNYKLEVCDPYGDIRALRAWLLFQRGLWDLVLDEGQKVAPLRESNPITQYNMARLHSKARNKQAATDCFFAALKAGYEDVKTVKGDNDMNAIRYGPNGRTDNWELLTKPNFSAKMEILKAGNDEYCNLGITNNSPFPIKGAVFTCTVSVTDAKGKQSNQKRRVKVEKIPPNSTWLWQDFVVATRINGLVPLKLPLQVEIVDFPVQKVDVLVGQIPFFYRGSSLFGQ